MVLAQESEGDCSFSNTHSSAITSEGAGVGEPYLRALVVWWIERKIRVQVRVRFTWHPRGHRRRLVSDVCAALTHFVADHNFSITKP